MAKPSKEQQESTTKEHPAVTVVNIAPPRMDPNKLAEVLDKMVATEVAAPNAADKLTDSVLAQQPQTPPEPKSYVACVCLDPYGRVVILHKDSADAQLTFPIGEILPGKSLEDAANAIMHAHAGVSAPVWEQFAYDAGSRTTYVRAHTRAVYDATHVCPDADGTVHVVTLDTITDLTQPKQKHIIWMVMLAVYGPLMDSLSFRCPHDL